MTDNMERQGATTFKGNPLTLVGPQLKAGEKAPDFEVVDGGLQPVSLDKTGDGVRIFSVLPSLDTPVCDIQTKRFNTEAAKMPNVKIFTISMDLPFAQKRYCDAFAVDNVKMLSDHKIRFLRRGVRHADQGMACGKPRDLRGGLEQHDPARRVRKGSGRSSRLRSGACESQGTRRLSDACSTLRLPEVLPRRRSPAAGRCRSSTGSRWRAISTPTGWRCTTASSPASTPPTSTASARRSTAAGFAMPMLCCSPDFTNPDPDARKRAVEREAR